MNIVVDTNVIVSAFWSRDGKPAEILGMVLNGRHTICYDHRIMTEYREVLRRPKFGFSEWEINSVLDLIETYGSAVVAERTGDEFIDESDKKFYEVAKFCGAVLVTGNIRHFPQKPFIMTVSDFLEKYN